MRSCSAIWGLTAIAAASLLVCMPDARAATATWSQLADGFWDADENWSTGVPRAGDDVAILLPGSRTATYRSGDISLASLSVDGANSLLVNGGTLTVAGSLQQSGAGGVTVSGGILQVNGSSHVDTLNLLAGTGAYVGRVWGSGTLTIGTLNWGGGGFSNYYGPVGGARAVVQGAALIDGTLTQYLEYGWNLQIASTGVWGAGNGSIQIGGSGASFEILPGAVLSDAGAAGINGVKQLGGYTADVAVINSGTYNRAGKGATEIVRLVNSGTLNVQEGELRLGPGSSSGTLNVASGALSSFTQSSYGSFQFTGGSIVNNGQLLIKGEAVEVGANVSYTGNGSVAVFGGTLTSAANMDIADLTVSTGMATFSGKVHAGVVNLFGGYLAAGADVVADRLSWWGGNLMPQTSQSPGSVTVTGDASIDGYATGKLLYGVKLQLNGNTTWTAGGGGISSANNLPSQTDSNALNIGASGRFTDGGAATASSARRLGDAGSMVVNNAGTFVRQGLGRTDAARFNNSGKLDIQSGTLTMVAGGSSVGTISVGPAGTLAFTTGLGFDITAGALQNNGVVSVGTYSPYALRLGPAATYSGSGAIRVSSGVFDSQGTSAISIGELSLTGGTASFAGELRAGALNITGGTLVSSGADVFADAFKWTAGNISGVRRLTVNGDASIGGNGSMRVSGNTVLLLGGRSTWAAGNDSLRLLGDSSSAPTLVIAPGGSLVDAGAADAQGNRALGGEYYYGAYYAGNGTINNVGTLERNGLGSTVIGSRLVNDGTIKVNGGTLRVVSGGQSNGSVNIAPGATLAFDTAAFTFASGAVVNSGVFDVRSGGTATLLTNINFSGNGTMKVSTGGLLDMSSSESNLIQSKVSLEGGTLRSSGRIQTDSLSLTNGLFENSGYATANSLYVGSARLGAAQGNGGGITTILGDAQIASYGGLELLGSHVLNLNGHTDFASGAYLYFSAAGSGANTLSIGSEGIFDDAGTAVASGTKSLGVSATYSYVSFGYLTSGRINNAGTYNRKGLGATSVGAYFANTGTLNVQAGAMKLSNGGSNDGVVNIADGATLELGGNNPFVIGGTVTHAGLLRIAGNVSATEGAVFAGSGAVQIQSGSFLSASALPFAASSLALGYADPYGSTYGVIASFAGPVSTGALTLLGYSDLSVVGDVTTDTLQWDSGTMRGAGSTSVKKTLALGVAGSNRALTDGRTLVLADGASGKLLPGRLDMSDGSALRISSGASLVDSDAPGGSSPYYYAAYPRTLTGGTVFNEGSYERGGLGSTTINSTFINSGSLNVRAGQMSLAGGRSSGVVDVADGARLAFGGGNFDFEAGSLRNAGTLSIASGAAVNFKEALAYTGAGTVSIEGGTLNVDGTRDLAALNMAAGVRGGAGTVNTDTFVWSGGTIGSAISPGGATTVNRSTHIAFSDSTGARIGGVVAAGHVLTLNGTTTWDAGMSSLRVAGGVGNRGVLSIPMGATFNDAGASYDYPFRVLGSTEYADALGQPEGEVNNAGTYNRGGTGTTLVVNFHSSGVVNVNSGRLRAGHGFINTGLLNIASGAVLQGEFADFGNGGRLIGDGTVQVLAADAAFVNRGTVDAGAPGQIGHLSVQGNLTLEASSVLDFDVAGLMLADQLSVSGSLVAGGTLNVHFLGDFVPQDGEEFALMSFASLTSGTQFDSVNLLGLSPGLRGELVYDASTVRLRLAAVPEPSEAALLALGGFLAVFAARRRVKI